MTQLWLCPQQHPTDSRPRIEKQFGGEYHLEDPSNNHRADQKELDQDFKRALRYLGN